jgi:hypothetical protein
VDERAFTLGVNLPWLRYGGDFGANAWEPRGGVSRPDVRARLAEVLARLADRGLSTVRWFLIGDGRAGLRLGADATPAGLDDRFLPDVDAALGVLRDLDLEVIFVLVDFLWFRRARRLRGVQMGGRAALVTSPRRRARLLDAVLEPILERYGRDPVIRAWDVINEPEWATRGFGARRLAPSVGRAEMRAFIGDVVERVHRRTLHEATVGLASARGLPLVRDLGLDFYQCHWYDSVEGRCPLERPVASLGLDRPLLLGEFPTRGSSRRPGAIVQAARRAGYAGALAWSVLADDEASDFDLLTGE